MGPLDRFLTRPKCFSVQQPYPPSASESQDSPVAQRSGCPTSNARSLAQQGRKRSSDVNQGHTQLPNLIGRGAILSPMGISYGVPQAIPEYYQLYYLLHKLSQSHYY